jgi:membrane associated rhomboid family serine protease
MTLGLSLLCLAARFVHAVLSPLQRRVLVDALGANPSRLARALDGGWDWSAWSPAFASLFIHSDWLHLLANLAYLWVFGLPLERRMGAAYLAAVFLFGGAVAHAALALRLPGLDVPVIGASGAVSAVVGAYLGLFPRRPIGLFLPLGVVVEFARVPGVLVIGSWFALQLLYATVGPISGAIAWWTHLTGFSCGLALALAARALGVLRRPRP